MNILHVFEQTAALYPDRTAIADRNVKYTFRQLKEKAQQLAFLIKNTGIYNKPVGVFGDRDADSVVMFFAVLYSGNFYIPLDAANPVAKLYSIIEDADVQVLIGRDKNRELLSQLNFSGSFFTLDDAGKDTYCAELDEIPGSAPAYMVYTSGSTGKPKGVLKSHGAVVSFVNAYTDTFSFTADDVIGNQTPFFFDASAKDIYLMAKTGASIEVLPAELFTLPVTLIRYLNEKKVTFISWVPTALSLVVQLNTFKEVLPETLEKVFFVGEVMPVKHLNKWIKALPDLQYVNLYGSSEMAGISCYYEIKGEMDVSKNLPMGQPLKNCEIFLVDTDGSFITEKDTVGEIYVVSEALATEYYKDPEKTADKFVMAATPSGEVCRVFKTGDMAKYDDDGNLVFSARKDFQIKHMGHRIELGEIETAAMALDGIEKSCCLYNEKKLKITLFCELTEGVELTGKQIQDMLKEKLSDYMIPKTVVIMDKLPLNANGKIHRQQLKEML